MRSLRLAGAMQTRDGLEVLSQRVAEAVEKTVRAARHIDADTTTLNLRHEEIGLPGLPVGEIVHST